MVDFLKANPFMSMEDYLWNYSIPMIKLMGIDNTHLDDRKNKESQIIDVDMKNASIEELNKDLGIKLNIPTQN